MVHNFHLIRLMASTFWMLTLKFFQKYMMSRVDEPFISVFIDPSVMLIGNHLFQYTVWNFFHLIFQRIFLWACFVFSPSLVMCMSSPSFRQCFHPLVYQIRFGWNWASLWSLFVLTLRLLHHIAFLNTASSIQLIQSIKFLRENCGWLWRGCSSWGMFFVSSEFAFSHLSTSQCLQKCVGWWLNTYIYSNVMYLQVSSLNISSKCPPIMMGDFL